MNEHRDAEAAAPPEFEAAKAEALRIGAELDSRTRALYQGVLSGPFTAVMPGDFLELINLLALQRVYVCRMVELVGVNVAGTIDNQHEAGKLIDLMQAGQEKLAMRQAEMDGRLQALSDRVDPLDGGGGWQPEADDESWRGDPDDD